ncbi:MAG: response regulator, partial [Lachnospiraceae bacterium]|nr:response regulator [Lachnospiraceae bacterium]
NEAIEMAGSISYDVILMDQRMPGMDGVEAMHVIKEQKDGANISTPMICLTADAVIGAKERYISQGFTDYLSKPIDSLALEKMLRTYLPKEKIIIIDPKDDTLTDNEDIHVHLAALFDGGIEVRKGIRNCGGDEKFYEAMLVEYFESAGEKKDLINTYFEKEDIKNYGVIAHAIKSTSATIGAAKLSEMAAKLEHAADEEDMDKIRAMHNDMLSLYEKTLDSIKPVINVSDKQKDKTEDDEVLEFTPS